MVHLTAFLILILTIGIVFAETVFGTTGPQKWVFVALTMAAGSIGFFLEVTDPDPEASEAEGNDSRHHPHQPPHSKAV